MKIAILSDIHDRTDHLADVLALIQEQGCERLLCLGDVCSPFSLEALALGFRHPIHVVLGNNDGDVLFFSRIEGKHEHLHLHGNFAEIELDDIPIAFTHYPNIALAVAYSGKYKAVFYGHTHEAEEKHLPNGCLLINPGEVMGRFGRVSFGVYDTTLESYQHIVLP